MLRVCDSEGLAICTLNGVYEALNPDSGIRLRSNGAGVSLGHCCVPDWGFAYQVRVLYFLTDDLTHRPGNRSRVAIKAKAIVLL
ncbi:hypothetical protein D3C78_1790600 [compost metagenome]